jgi:multicomponent Na+:H+ antiporter subunit B
MAGYLTNILLLALLVFILVLVIRTRRLFPVVVLAGAYSLVSAAMFVNLDAVDVAFTEAAVGAGISTVLFLAAMAYLPAVEKTPPEAKGISHILPALIICVCAGALLVAAAIELPPVGDPTAPPHVHVAPRYLEESGSFLHIPNVVTTVLASYRGFDTFGEVVVVFTAGLGVLVLLAGFTRTARVVKTGAAHDDKSNGNSGEGGDA